MPDAFDAAAAFGVPLLLIIAALALGGVVLAGLEAVARWFGWLITDEESDAEAEQARWDHPELIAALDEREGRR